MEKHERKLNNVSQTFWWLGIIGLVIGIAILLMTFLGEADSFAFGIAGIADFLFCLPISEVIQLLEDIKNK